MLIPALILMAIGGWPWAGLAALAVFAPAAGYAPTVLRPRKLPPMYARALARMKFGKYDEAEWEIIKQLEKQEDDFEGWMMLAELYATHFHDIQEAERTIVDICSQPKTTPPQLSLALHRLADWQLKLAGDPEAARRALQLICERLPGTHLARMAQLRLNQVPATREDLRDLPPDRPIPLPPLREEPKPAQTQRDSDRRAALAQVNRCVEKLQQNPDDSAVRERLARLLTEQLGRFDQGLEQIQLLLGMPDQPDASRAEWLALAAAWQLNLKQDQPTALQTMERLVREYPETPQAFAAKRRLWLMDMERKAKAVAPQPKPTIHKIEPPNHPGAPSEAET